MKDLDDFVKNNSPNRRKSKLEPFREAIYKLYDDGYQVEQIIDFLSKNKVQTSKQNLYKFLKAQKNSLIKTTIVGEADQNSNQTENDDEEITLSDLRKRFKKNKRKN